MKALRALWAFAAFAGLFALATSAPLRAQVGVFSQVALPPGWIAASTTTGVTTTGTAWLQQTAGRSMLAANYTNATAAFTNTALSFNVTNARKYVFNVDLFVIDSTAADGAQIDFGGGSATATNFRAHCILNDTTTTILSSAVVTALNTAIQVATVTGQAQWACNGSFEPSSTGTFILRGAQVAHTTGTLTVNRGSFTIVEDVP